jgi:hypothetical protein
MDDNASIFNAFGSRIQLFQIVPRILHAEEQADPHSYTQADTDPNPLIVTGSLGRSAQAVTHRKFPRIDRRSAPWLRDGISVQQRHGTDATLVCLA